MIIYLRLESCDSVTVVLNVIFLKRLQLSTGSRNSATGFMTETQRDILLFGDDNEEREDSLQGRRQSEWQVISLKFFLFEFIQPAFSTHCHSTSRLQVLKERIGVFSSPDRLHLLETLKKYHQSLVERSELLAKNSHMSRHNQELAMILRRSQTA